MEDDTGELDAIWFNQKYLIDTFSRNPYARLSGKIRRDPKKGLVMSNPVSEPASSDPNHTGRIVPVYPETKGITSRWLRWQIGNIFKADFEIEDPLPKELLKKYHLPSLKKSLYDIHFPSSDNAHLVAQKRFAFFDMLLVQIKSLQIKKNWKKESAQKLDDGKKDTEKFLKKLKFELTDDQSVATAGMRPSPQK